MKGDTINRSELKDDIRKWITNCYMVGDDQTPEVLRLCIDLVDAQSVVAAAPEWIRVEDGLPKDRKSVNVVVEHKREDGKIFQFVMTASHIGHHEIEAEEWPDYDGDTEYDEENDCFWIPENWYEDNFMEDNMNYLICDEYRVTHWMPLPSTEGLDDAT